MDESKANDAPETGEQEKKPKRKPSAPPLFGSAGMAASGMLPRQERKREEAAPEPEEASTEEPTDNEPIAEEPIAEEPTIEEPSADEPIIEEPKEPSAEEPSAEELTADEPIADEPIAEVPIAEEPADDEQTDEDGLSEILASLNLLNPSETTGEAEDVGKTDSEEVASGPEDEREGEPEVEPEDELEVEPEGEGDADPEQGDAESEHGDGPEAGEEADPDDEVPFAVFIQSSLANRYGHLKEALLAGSHAYCEHPVAATLREADELLALSESKALRLTPDLPWRRDPVLRLFHAERESLIGELLALHVHGACDESAGGLDLLRHGPELFDIARWFAGEIACCHAEITEEGMPAIAEDAREDEAGGLGLHLGDRIEAAFHAENEVLVHFHSDPRRRRVSGPMGIEFIGREGRARWFAGPPSRLSLLVSSDPESPERADRWELWPGRTELAVDAEAASEEAEAAAGSDADSSEVDPRVRAWLAETFPGPLPDPALVDSIKALEMVHALWQAGATRRRTYFPLSNRLHPLAEDSRE